MSSELAVVGAAAAAADELVDRLGLPIRKAIDIGTPRGFDQAVARLAARLGQIATPNEAAALREAIAVLDVDWHATSPEQRRRLVSEAMVRAGRRTAVVATRIRAPLDESAVSVVSSTRTSARRRHGLAIAAQLGAVDRRVIAHVVRSQGNFVWNEYGRRVDALGAEARKVVADGLEAGLGRQGIAEKLAEAAHAALVKRAPWYWETVASSFIGRGRAFAQLGAFAEAGIERWQYLAVLDEVTTPTCRFLHGRVFTVRASLDRFDEVDRLTDPEDIKKITPWVRERRDPRTGRTQLVVDHARGRIALADVIRSGAGARDDQGAFRARVSDAELSSLGVAPPSHAHCRASLQPA